MILKKTHAHKGSKPNEGIMIGKKNIAYQPIRPRKGNGVVFSSQQHISSRFMSWANPELFSLKHTADEPSSTAKSGQGYT